MGWRRTAAGALGVATMVALLGSAQAVGSAASLAFYADKAAYEAAVGSPTTSIDFQSYAGNGDSCGQAQVVANPLMVSGVTFTDPHCLSEGQMNLSSPAFQYHGGVLRFVGPLQLQAGMPASTIDLPPGTCGVGINVVSNGVLFDAGVLLEATDATTTVSSGVHFFPGYPFLLQFVGFASDSAISQVRWFPDPDLVFGFSPAILSVELTACGAGGGDSASGVAPPGGSVSTGTAASPSDPVETTVTTPSGGPVTISEGEVTTTTPSGYALFGQQVEISAPDASTANPLRLVFTVDASAVPAGQDETTVQVFRNGQLAPYCPGAVAVALGLDPCVTLRERLGDGDIRLTVLSSHASLWTFGAHVPLGFGGFSQPVDNIPVINQAKAGSAIPVRFDIPGTDGLAVASGYPRSAAMTCNSNETVDAIEETVTAGGSSLAYTPSTGRYTYTWKTEKSWAGSCRQLAIKLIDGTTRRATFQFK